MIPGVEGLALIPLLPLLFFGLPLVGLGFLFLLGGAVARGCRKPYACSLAKAGAWTAGPGAAMVLIFCVAAIELKSRTGWSALPVRHATASLTFDLRTARTFEALGLERWVERSTLAFRRSPGAEARPGRRPHLTPIVTDGCATAGS